jgi:preprotein translocase subunit SecE
VQEIWFICGDEAMNKIFSFLTEVVSELKKVTWPTRDELVGSTIIVCILVVVFAIILGAMDSAFSFLIRYLIR